MMHPITTLRPTSPAEALAALAAPDARPMGGGTDLLVQRQEGRTGATTLVELRHLPGLVDVVLHDDGSATIGAAVPLAELAAHAGVAQRYPALAQAAAAAGGGQPSPGTIGGSVCQRPRCTYFRRGTGVCLKRGGTGCAARQDAHAQHAAWETGPCWAALPSDVAVALAALEAVAHVVAPAGERALGMDALFAPAPHDPEREVDVPAGAYLAAFTLPATAAGGTQCFLHEPAADRSDGTPVSLAAHLRTDGEVRLVFGGMAAGPLPVDPRIAEDLSVGGVDDESLDALAERAMYDAAPLPGTAFKVPVAQTLLRRAGRLLDPLP